MSLDRHALAILPREAITPTASATGLVVVPLADSWAMRRFAICWRSDETLSASTRALIEHLRQQAAAGVEIVSAGAAVTESRAR